VGDDEKGRKVRLTSVHPDALLSASYPKLLESKKCTRAKTGRKEDGNI
jgi:hypothetical protein